MRRSIAFFIGALLLLSSCTKPKNPGKTEPDKISFLSRYGVVVDSIRPYYSSTIYMPEILDAVWEIRNIFSKDTLGIDIVKFKGKQCEIYMYPVSKLPFNVKKDLSKEARAVVVCYKNEIICSHIEFISELRTLPPMSLKGKTLVELSKVEWDTWKNKIDSDGDKRLVICQYYDALRSGNYDVAYWYIYDKENIKKEEFIDIAKGSSLPYIDFLDIGQYKDPTGEESFFLVKAKVGNSKGLFKKKTYEITFDLKRDLKEKEYGGWKIYKTKIK